MDGNSRLIIAFFILFIRNGSSQRLGSFEYQRSSTGFTSQGFGASFGDGLSYGTQIGSNSQGRNRGVSDSIGWNAGSSFGNPNVENYSKKISTSGNSKNQWDIGYGRNSGSQTGGYAPIPNASSFVFGSNQDGISDGKNQGSGRWSYGNWNDSEPGNPMKQSGKGQNNEENGKRTNSNFGSRKPAGSSGSSTSDFSFNFQNEEKVAESEYGGSTETQKYSSKSSPDWGFHSSSRRPQGSRPSENSNWKSDEQNVSKNSGFSGLGFSSSKHEERQNHEFNDSWRKPQGSSSSDNFNLSFGSDSDPKRLQGGSNGGSLTFDYDSNSDSKISQGSNIDGNWNWSSSSNFNHKIPENSVGNLGSRYSSSKKPNPNYRQRPSLNASESPQRQSGMPENGNLQPDTTGENNKEFEDRKPNGNGNKNANKAKTELDWSNLETQNQQSSPSFDLSELWYPNDKKDPAWKSIWTRNRFKRENDDPMDKTGNTSLVCHCTDYPACSPENRMNVLKFLKTDHKYLRNKMVECTTKKKICCATSKRESNGYTRPACGKRVSKLAEHDISSDGSANYGDYPWILKLVAVGDAGEQTLCSASLMHNSVALTTAACALLLTGKDVRVRSGEWNVYGGNHKNKEEATIKKVYLHPEFDIVTYRKDIALLFLNKPVHYGQGADVVCLPTHHETWDANKCVVVGWTRKNISGLESAVLKQIPLDFVVQGKCRHRDGLKNVLSDLKDPGYLCVHTRKDDPYLGDIGASLLCPLDSTDRLIQVGFVSNSVPGKVDYKTATFTNILGYLGWVHSIEDLFTPSSLANMQ